MWAPWATAYYWHEGNDKTLDQLHTHSEDKVFWRLPCQCLLYKSPHAVCDSARRMAALRLGEGSAAPPLPPALQCPWHGPRPCSMWQQFGYEMLQEVAVALECRFVLEARVVDSKKAFDAWVPCAKLLIEFDGEGHSRALAGSMHGHKCTDQQAIDARHSTMAMQAGYTVLRMHFGDAVHWRALLLQVLRDCVTGAAPPRLLGSPAYAVEGLTMYTTAGV